MLFNRSWVLLHLGFVQKLYYLSVFLYALGFYMNFNVFCIGVLCVGYCKFGLLLPFGIMTRVRLYYWYVHEFVYVRVSVYLNAFCI